MNLIQMSFIAGILIIGITVFRAFFINHIPKKVMILLWEIAILRLVIPVAFSLPFPGLGDLGGITMDAHQSELIMGVFTDAAPEKGWWNVAQGTGAFAEDEAAGITEISVVTEDTAETFVTVVSMDKSCLLWIFYGLVAFVFAAGSFYLYFRDSQFFREGLPMPEKEKQLLLLLLEEKDRERMRKVKFRISDRTASPVTYGIFRPAVVFPKSLYQNPQKEVAFWLRHELVHIRHHDNLKKLAARGVLCLHWFNPLVLLMFFLFNRDMELLCDETVVRRKQESRKDYALALLSMAQQKSRDFQTGLGFGKNAVTERITAVMKYKMTVKGILGAAVAVVAALTAFGSHYVSYAANTIDTAANVSAAETTEYAVISADVSKIGNLVIGESTDVTWEAMPGTTVTVTAVKEDLEEGTADASEAAEYTEPVSDLVEESAYVSEEAGNSIERAIDEYREYGLSITLMDGDYQLYYEDEPVYFFADNTIPEEEGFSGRLFLREESEENGKTGVITQYDATGEVTGIKQLTEEESRAYTSRWR